MSEPIKPFRVTGFYAAKSGFRSFVLDAKAVEALQSLSEGSQVWLYENTHKEKDSQPDYNMVFYTPEQVEARKREFAERKESGSFQAPPKQIAKKGTLGRPSSKVASVSSEDIPF